MKVSVIITTFNHERFIAEAIRSVLVQDTTFPFEIIISEDCSTDQTRKIISEFAQAYPDRIRLLLSQHNLHTNEVWTRAFAASGGEYLAFLDGDDYWTCPTKLQRQVEYLDAHPECSICFHNMQVFQDGVFTHNSNLPTQPEQTDLADLLVGDFIPTGSTMLRRKNVLSLPTWFNAVYCADSALMVLNARFGRIGYISETMAIYRAHSAGAWSGLSDQDQLLHSIRLYATIQPCLGFRHRSTARRQESRLWYQLALTWYEMGQQRLAFGCLRKTLYDLPCTIKLLLYFAHPKLFESIRRSWRRFRLRPL